MATLRTIYNSTDNPLFVDRVGHIVGAHEWRDGVDIDAVPAKTYVADGRFVVMASSTSTSSTSSATTTAKASA